MTSGERAARRFVRDGLPTRVYAALRELRNEGYERVLSACRVDLNLPPRDNDRPSQLVLASVPAAYRRAIERPLAELLDAEYDRRRVTERAAYLVGVVVGKASACSSRQRRRRR